MHTLPRLMQGKTYPYDKIVFVNSKEGMFDFTDETNDQKWINCNTKEIAKLLAASVTLLQLADLVLKGIESGNIKAEPVFIPDFDGENFGPVPLEDLVCKVIEKAL